MTTQINGVGAKRIKQFLAIDLRHIPILSTWADGRVATGGGDHTLNRGQTGGPNSDPYRHSHGAAYRAVYDLGNPENSRFSLATGQSGNPFRITTCRC